ncbi:MAG: S1 family peptidase [Euryarchaeota archaeon]|nr:S1 family peptidase [Euryarchaeota archaeon]
MITSSIGFAFASPNAKDVREKHEQKLFEIDGISGVSVDESTNEIVVYTEDAEKGKKVPKSLDGINVKQEVIGKITALSTTTLSRTTSYNPVFGGISVGNPYITAGTLGLVTTLTLNGNQVALSNAHVLALDSRNRFLPKVTTPIYQPGVYDGGNNGDTIGYLYNYIPISFNNNRANNKADAAIATLTILGNVGDVLDADNINFYHISGTVTANVGDTVRKSGRTTDVTTGIVTSTSASVKVSYGGKWALFKDQIVVGTPGFSAGGDSGSAVDINGKFTGLLFAGSNTVTIVNKESNIIEQLGITI